MICITIPRLFLFVVVQVALVLLGRSVSIGPRTALPNALALLATTLYTARRARAVSESPAAEPDEMTASV